MPMVSQPSLPRPVHPAPADDRIDEALAARCADRALLAEALTDARERLLRLWAAYQRGLADPALRVPCQPELNLPLWELGHIAWFEEFWIARNPRRAQGVAADPEVARAAPLLASADALYHSSRVPHARRWHLALPDAPRTLAMAAQVRQRTLRLLADATEDDAGLYFFRLALHHEDMHREAWVYMAQALGLALADAQPANGPAPAGVEGDWVVTAHTHRLGSAADAGFAFDNEWPAHDVALAHFAIDRAPVTWARFLPFIEAGGYDQAQWWTLEGWAWRQRHGSHADQPQGLLHPRHLRRLDDGQWQCRRFGTWQALVPGEPAVHLCRHEALAWCAWAGRRLPSEAEWEAAATLSAARGEAFAWGQVWEWTASAFAPYASPEPDAGFQPHPYRDYSAPWFDGRPVLRGASFATAPRLRHPRYRNFFPAERNDIFAGFRTCA